MTYAPLVKYIVFKKVRELPARCEVEDFISCGLEALIASIDRYDPEKGATLEQFAWTRIHGAVLDELRRQDWAPRSLRRWERDIAKARDQFTTIHGRRPIARGARRRRSRSRSRSCARREDDIAVSDVTSLNTLVISDDETTVERIDTLADGDHRLDPEHAGRRHRGQGEVPPGVRHAAPARARGRRPALRQEPDAARDRRGPGRLREPHLPDPLAAEAHAQAAAVRRRGPLLGRRLRASRELTADLSGTMSFEIGRASRPSALPLTPPQRPVAPVPASAPCCAGASAKTDRSRPSGSPARRRRSARDGPGRRPPRGRAHGQNRELHFAKDPSTSRVIVQVRDLDGNVLKHHPARPRRSPSCPAPRCKELPWPPLSPQPRLTGIASGLDTTRHRPAADGGRPAVAWSRSPYQQARVTAAPVGAEGDLRRRSTRSRPPRDALERPGHLEGDADDRLVGRDEASTCRCTRRRRHRRPHDPGRPPRLLRPARLRVHAERRPPAVVRRSTTAPTRTRPARAR